MLCISHKPPGDARTPQTMLWGFPSVSVVKNLPVNAEDAGSLPEWGKSPGEANGTSLQYPCLGNPMDRRVWWARNHK